MGGRLYQIVGVGPAPFTGTETGTVTDVFVPTMMHPGVTHDDWTWHRTLARVRPGVALEPLRAKLDATSRAFEEERAKGFKGMTARASRVPRAEGHAGARGRRRSPACSRITVPRCWLSACWWRWCC